MIRWSRVRLILSIVFAEGLWRTAAERFQWAGASGGCGRSQGRALPAIPRHSDYAGAAHIHSTHSDGTGTVPEIAEAAARAGLDFLLLADHNTFGARIAGDERWHETGKVLVGVGAEITTSEGHLLVFDVPTSFLPPPDGPSNAMRSIHEMGGYGYIALPCDLKGHWGDFSTRVSGIGLEVFNLSAIARTKLNVPGFLMAMLRYRGSKPITAFSLIAGRPDAELKLWDELLIDAARRGEPMPNALGCLDAHAVMRIAGQEYPYPTYEEVFRTLRTHVLTREPLSNSNDHVADDLATLHGAIKAGQTYISYDNFADPKGFVFELRHGCEYAGGMGETVDAALMGGEAYSLAVRVPHTRTVVRLFRDGRLVDVKRGGAIDYKVVEAGVYRVEVYIYKGRIGNLCFGARPWIFSNALVVKKAAVGAPAAPKTAVAGAAKSETQIS